MKRISTFFSVAFGLILLAVLLSMNVFSYNLNSKSVENSVILQLEQTAKTQGSSIESLMKNIEFCVDHLSMSVSSRIPESVWNNEIERSVFVDKSIEGMKDFLIELSEDLEEYDTAYIVLDTGKAQSMSKITVTNYGDHFDLFDVPLSRGYMTETDRSELVWYYGPLESGRGMWSDLYYDQQQEAEMITYSVPVFVGDTAVGIVGVDLKFSSIVEMVESNYVSPSRFGYLLNDNFDFLVHPVFDPSVNVFDLQDADVEGYVAKLQQAPTGAFTYSYKGEGRHFGYYQLYNGWYSGVVYFSNDLFKEIYPSKFNIVLGSIVLIMIFIILVIISGRVVEKPVRELMLNVRRLYDMDFKTSIDSKLLNNTTEIGTLARSIERMRGHLLEAYDKISETGKALESSAQQRRLELQDINYELGASLQELKINQQKLVEINRQNSMKLLMQNFAHRLNTPVGQVITIVSYLIDHLKGNRQIERSDLELLTSSQVAIQGIISKLFYVKHFHAKPSHVDVRQILDSEIKDLTDENKVEITYTLNQRQDLLMNEMLFRVLIHNLLRYPGSYMAHFKGTLNLNIGVTTLLEYHVHGLMADAAGNIFEPFSEKGFKTGKEGMELFIVKDIVERGLGGTIGYHEENGQGLIRITVRSRPKKSQ